jgi:hypothetical protein
MARRGRPSTRNRKTVASDLEALSAFLLATADNNDEEMIALAMAAAAIEARQNARSKKYGVRGAYNQKKSSDFSDILLYQSSSRSFQSWFRCVQLCCVHSESKNV